MRYLYRCPACGEFEQAFPADSLMCRCGQTARRVFQVSFDRQSTKPGGRWDPVVGTYVENHGQFLSELHKSQDAQSERLGLDVKLATVDSRDTAGLDELRGWSSDQREADLEDTRRARHDRMNA